jgi:hypothetical protein
MRACTHRPLRSDTAPLGVLTESLLARFGGALKV